MSINRQLGQARRNRWTCEPTSIYSWLDVILLSLLYILPIDKHIIAFTYIQREWSNGHSQYLCRKIFFFKAELKFTKRSISLVVGIAVIKRSDGDTIKSVLWRLDASAEIELEIQRTIGWRIWFLVTHCILPEVKVYGSLTKQRCPSIVYQ